MGQALVLHDREEMVLSTLEEVFLSGFILPEDQGGHPPDHMVHCLGQGVT